MDEYVILDQEVAAQNRIVLRIVNTVLGSVRASILAEAAKFTDGDEQEYRAGMEHSAHMIRREIEQRERLISG